MQAVGGRTYALIVAGKIYWIFTSAQLPEWAADQITVADITGVSPSPAVGWTAVQTSGTWAFTAPAAPPSPPAPTPAQLASAALAAGLTLTSTGTPALNATYALDAETRSDLQGEMISLMKNETFTNGTTTLGWPDTGSTMHAFGVTQFEAFATAMAAYVGALKTIIATNSGSLPSASVTIA